VRLAGVLYGVCGAGYLLWPGCIGDLW